MTTSTKTPGGLQTNIPSATAARRLSHADINALRSTGQLSVNYTLRRFAPILSRMKTAPLLVALTLTMLGAAAGWAQPTQPAGQVGGGQTAAMSPLQRDALWNWMTYGRTPQYTPERACSDGRRDTPPQQLAACISFIRVHQSLDRRFDNTKDARRADDEERAIKELVERAANGDDNAAERCQWSVDGLQREGEAWQKCRVRTQQAFSRRK